MRIIFQFLVMLTIAFGYADLSLAEKSNIRGGCTCGTTKFHSGADWTAPTGTPIPVAETGTVVTVELNEGAVDYQGGTGFCGRYVVILHKLPNGKPAYTRYAQLGSTLDKDGRPIRIGQTVAKGQVIGQVGKLGLFHFEVRPFSSGNKDWTSVATVDPSSFDFEDYGRKK